MLLLYFHYRGMSGRAIEGIDVTVLNGLIVLPLLFSRFCHILRGYTFNIYTFNIYIHFIYIYIHIYIYIYIYTHI